MPTVIDLTVGGSAPDHATLGAWESARPANLVTADEQWNAHCRGVQFDEQLLLTGTTSDATRFSRITVQNGHRHLGLEGVGARVIPTFNLPGNDDVIHGDEPFTVLEWLEVSYEGAANNDDNSSSGCKLQGSNCDMRWLFSHDIHISGRNRGLSTTINPEPVNFYSCMVHTVVRGASATNNSSGIRQQAVSSSGNQTRRIQGCTVWNVTGAASRGFEAGDGLSSDHRIWKNNLSFGAATAYSMTGSETDWDVDYNTGDGATADDKGGANNRIGAQVGDYFVATGGPVDLNLKAGSPAIATGLDMGDVTNKIDAKGFDRHAHGGAWGRGALEYSEPGPSGLFLPPSWGRARGWPSISTVWR